MNYKESQQQQSNEKSGILEEARDKLKKIGQHSEGVIDLIVDAMYKSSANASKIRQFVNSDSAVAKLAEYTVQLPEKFDKAVGAALRVLNDGQVTNSSLLSTVIDGSLAGDNDAVLGMKVRKASKNLGNGKDR